MHETGVKLLNLMFREGESICVSHNKYGYHSIPLPNAFKGTVTLVPTLESCERREIAWDEKAYEYVDSSQLLLVALNPIKGFRTDANCTAFRNFLIEMDTGELKQQLEYIKHIGMPYSAIVFSGSKSLHFLISLDKDLPSEAVYRLFSEWTLNIATASDQNCKNPSRSIRIPGAWREPTKLQRIVELKGPVQVEDMIKWLKTYPRCKPQPVEKREVSKEFSHENIAKWVRYRLLNGLDPMQGRNKQWFAIACEFALAGMSEDDTVDILARYFQPERDFKEREWKTSIRSGFKHIYESRG